MTEQKVYNLDEGAEAFPFTLKGHRYFFKYPTTEEAEELQKAAKDSEETKKLIVSLISKERPESPDFEKMYLSMNAKHWMNFRKMVSEEFSLGA